MAGVAIYLLYRPTSLKAFDWIRSVGVLDPLMLARSCTQSRIAIASWIEYSAPGALWAISWVFFIGGIWRGHSRTTIVVWMLIVPAVGVLSEFLQANAVLPGRFDVQDVTAYCTAVPIAGGLSALLGGVKGES